MRHALQTTFDWTTSISTRKKTVKTGQTLKTAVITVAQGTGWVNAVLICDDFPELGTNLVSALASQAREMCRCIPMPHMPATGLRILEVCQRKKDRKSCTKKRDKTSILQTSGIWPPWTCTSSRMAAKAREVETENTGFVDA